MRPEGMSEYIRKFPLPHTIATKTFVTNIFNEIEKARLFWEEDNNYVTLEDKYLGIKLGGGYASGGITINKDGSLKIGGKLTVDGEIDPTAILLTPSASPAVVEEGKIYYNATDHKPYWYDETLTQKSFGISALSKLTIDADKDWNGKSITNLTNLSLIGNLHIDTDSATALLIENSSVPRTCLVVDSDTGDIGIGAPPLGGAGRAVDLIIPGTSGSHELKVTNLTQSKYIKLYTFESTVDTSRGVTLTLKTEARRIDFSIREDSGIDFKVTGGDLELDASNLDLISGGLEFGGSGSIGAVNPPLNMTMSGDLTVNTSLFVVDAVNGLITANTDKTVDGAKIGFDFEMDGAGYSGGINGFRTRLYASALGAAFHVIGFSKEIECAVGESAAVLIGDANSITIDGTSGQSVGFVVDLYNNVAAGVQAGFAANSAGTQVCTAGLALGGSWTNGIDFSTLAPTMVTGINFTGSTVSGNAIEMAGFGINADSWSITGVGAITCTGLDAGSGTIETTGSLGIGITPSYPFHFTYTPSTGMSTGKYSVASSALPTTNFTILDYNSLTISGGTGGAVIGGWLVISGAAPDIGVSVIGEVNNSVVGANSVCFVANSTNLTISDGYTFGGASPVTGGLFTTGISFGRVANTFVTGIDFTGAVISGDAIDMGSFGIVNLVDPTNPQDAATRAYVLSQISVESLDDAYDNGSAIAVDGANVVWTLTDIKEFNIFESGGDNIFSVKALAAGDEVHIGDATNTPVNLELYGNLNMHSDITGVANVTVSNSYKVAADTVIDSSRNINCGAITAGGIGNFSAQVRATQYNIGASIVIDTSKNITGVGITGTGVLKMGSGAVQLTDAAGKIQGLTSDYLASLALGKSGDTFDLNVAGVTYTRPLQMVNFYYAANATLNEYAVGDAGETDKGFQFGHAGSIVKVHISARTASTNARTTTFTIKNETDVTTTTFVLPVGVTSDNIDITDLAFDAGDEISIQITALTGVGTNAADFNIVLHYTQTGA